MGIMRTTERTRVLKNFFTKDETAPIDEQINSVLREMSKKGVLSEEYQSLMTHLERLYEIKKQERTDPVSRDTIALIAGNLMGILIIVAYEQKHVLTSKGFSQILRPK